MSTYSRLGPQCPHCDHVITPDGPDYYNEQNYTKDTCEICGKEFTVEVQNTTAWVCEEIEDDNTDGPTE